MRFWVGFAGDDGDGDVREDIAGRPSIVSRPPSTPLDHAFNLADHVADRSGRSSRRQRAR